MAYDASVGAYSSAYGMGLSYFESAKGIYLLVFLFNVFFVYLLNNNEFFVILFYTFEYFTYFIIIFTP